MDRRKFLASAIGLGVVFAGDQSPVCASTSTDCPRLKRYQAWGERAARQPFDSNEQLAICKRIADKIEFHSLDVDASYYLLPVVSYAAIYGDCFLEVPRFSWQEFLRGDYQPYELFKRLPANTMWRIQTVSDKLIEFQQGRSVDYKAVSECFERINAGCSVIRFTPQEIVHLRPNMRHPFSKETFPYGVSALETRLNRQFENDIGDGLADLLDRIQR